MSFMKSKRSVLHRKVISQKSPRVASLNQTIFSKHFSPTHAKFIDTVMLYYKKHGRHDLPWRQTTDPYKILVSEMMLQQTQVSRVIPKYNAFLKEYPDVQSLAQAELGDVYALWQGLGYNRRARFLRNTARAVTKNIEAKLRYSFPESIENLEELPGVGPYTARALYTFAYNKPCVLIETNVRACVLHHFFPKAKKGQVHDARIEKVMKDCIAHIDADPQVRLLFNNHVRPWREWYSALMDYGTHLKEVHPNPSRKSRTHVVQKKFKGSVREVRGAILELLGRQKMRGYMMQGSELRKKLKKFDSVRYNEALAGLMKDGMLRLEKKGRVEMVSLAK
jgi:A/G-specific adenine glycosylase